ncbi:Protein ACTIVITY OF BC1 COMPLEX KINASE 3, chloroplastic, partial [Linum grandiflorum]
PERSKLSPPQLLTSNHHSSPPIGCDDEPRFHRRQFPCPRFIWIEGVAGRQEWSVRPEQENPSDSELRKIFTRLGPTFVKLGQGLSTRPGICPPEFLEELAELRVFLFFLSLSVITSSVRKELEKNSDCGQVYKAQLKSSGQIVAVKVQRPGIEEVIGLDFYLVRGLGGLINKYVDFITSDVVALIDEFACRVYQELNYVQHEAIESQGLKVLDLVNTGIQCSLRQLLEYGYFHADPHPAMAQDYYALKFLSRDVDVTPIVPALQNFFDDALNYTVSELNFKTLVDGLGAVFYQYPFNVPAYYALILRPLTVLEGLALNADPNFKVLAASYPYFAKRLLTDPNSIPQRCSY